MTVLTRIATLLMVATLSLFVGACAKRGQVHVTKDLKTKLSEYPTVHISATGTGAKLNRAASKFETILGNRLTKAGVFTGVGADAGLVLRCKVTHMEFGDEVKRELSLKGKAKVTIEIRITEPDGKLLGHITATAQSARKGAKDQPAVRVLEMAADAVVTYMKARAGKKAGAKAPAPEKKSPPAGEDESSVEESTGEDEADADEESGEKDETDQDEDAGKDKDSSKGKEKADEDEE